MDSPWPALLGSRSRRWDFLLLGDLLFPQPALDGFELVGRHPVPGREVTCRQTLHVSSHFPGDGG